MSSRPFPAVPGVAVEHGFVSARGVRFHVAQAGPSDGEPLLLLHGWPQHWFTWRKVLPALAAEHRCVMPDLRGLGWSEAPPSGYDKESLASDMLGVMDALGLERVRMIGHDWGGWCGFLMALREPERFERFVALNIQPPWASDPSPARAALGAWRLWYQLVLGSALGPRIVANQRRMARAIRSDNGHPDAFSDADLAEFTAVLADPGRAHATVGIYREFVRREIRDLLRGRYDDMPLRVPTLLIHGTRDRVIARRSIEHAARPGDPLEVALVPDSGHFITDERPDVVAERALAFFAAG